MHKERMNQLLYEALETEIGGVQVYEAAVQCAINDELKQEWKKYREETEEHQKILKDVFQELGLDPEKETPGRQVVREIGQALVQAINLAKKSGDEKAAQIVAAECVVHAETKDHLNWELIGMLADEIGGSAGKALKDAYQEVEQQEDEHLYHTLGWARELHIESLGMKAVLPPPEEEQDVRSAIEAARVKKARVK